MQKTTKEDAMKMLTQIKYPVTKQDLIKSAKESKVDDEMTKQLSDLQDKEFMTSGDVMKELKIEDADHEDK